MINSKYKNKTFLLCFPRTSNQSRLKKSRLWPTQNIGSAIQAALKIESPGESGSATLPLLQDRAFGFKTNKYRTVFTVEDPDKNKFSGSRSAPPEKCHQKYKEDQKINFVHDVFKAFFGYIHLKALCKMFLKKKRENDPRDTSDHSEKLLFHWITLNLHVVFLICVSSPHCCVSVTET